MASDPNDTGEDCGIVGVADIDPCRKAELDYLCECLADVLADVVGGTGGGGDPRNLVTTENEKLGCLYEGDNYLGSVVLVTTTDEDGVSTVGQILVKAGGAIVDPYEGPHEPCRSTELGSEDNPIISTIYLCEPEG